MVRRVGEDIEDIDSSGPNTCQVSTDGVVNCRGDNDSWQLGRSPDELPSSDVPLQIPIPRAEAVRLGRGVACAIQVDRTVCCWGNSVLMSFNPGWVQQRSPTALASGAVSLAASGDLIAMVDASGNAFYTGGFAPGGLSPTTAFTGFLPIGGL